MTAATTVLPTSVPVPVTKTPVHGVRLGGERRPGRCGRRRRPRARAPPRRTAAAARRSSSSRWVAITVKRSREEPSGTVGGRIPWAKTPASSSALAELPSSAPASPTSTGTIWVSEPPTARPSAAQRRAQDRGVGAQPLDPAGLRLEQLQRRLGGGDRRRRRARWRR